MVNANEKAYVAAALASATLSVALSPVSGAPMTVAACGYIAENVKESNVGQAPQSLDD